MKTPVLLSFLLFCALTSFAQREAPASRHTISAQVGYGWFGLFNNAAADVSFDDGTNSNEYTAIFNGTPTATVAYDYRLGRVFSLGAAVGFQSLDIAGIRNANTNEAISGTIDINRTFISARTLFHYGGNSKWDLYSGARIGGTVWNVTSTVDRDEITIAEGITVGSGTAVFPHLTLIPIGVKHYPNERLMIGAELATGSPHFIAFQLGVRL